MIILRTDHLGIDGEMTMRLIRCRGGYFVQATHESMPFLVGFRRIICENPEQAERSYCRSVEASSAELMANT
jgi:hypothetical protein